MYRIDLTNYSHVFKDNELSELKEKIFIYGKNGTGKSTICHAIKEQMGGEYDIRTFQGFESVISEDKKLNSIILGENNNKIQLKIDLKKEVIGKKINKSTENSDLIKSLKGYDNVEKSTLLIQYEKADINVKEKTKEINSVYQICARELTTEFNLARNYNRNNFSNDIKNARKLTEEEYKELLAIFRTGKKEKIVGKKYPNINFEKYRESVNNILKSKVSAIVITELKGNPSKRDFAEKGLELHEKGDTCSFCGGKVTGERIEKLESVFNTKEVFGLQERIKSEIQRIEKCKEILINLDIMDVSDFYSHLDFEKVNSQLVTVKNEQISFLDECRKKLEQKEKELFTRLEHFEIEIPSSFNSVQTDIDKLVLEHNEFSNNIEESREKAKLKLILHRVAEKCEEIQNQRLEKELKIFEETRDSLKEVLEKEISNAESNIRDIELDLKQEKKELKQLQDKIKNPEIIIKKINEKISKSGKKNLELRYIESGKHYKIINKDGTTRNIQEISTGEKNIIAFLYFIGSLESLEIETGKPKIIILDDPMNSNDDTMQYLIISEIEKLYNKRKMYSHFILLTHNSHFYLKATHGRRMRRDGKNAYEVDSFIRMVNDGNLTTFRYLTDKKEDFATQYGSLWKELKFLFENDKKDFMCNTIRRIIETYIVFNGISGNGDSESKMLFNTNSHYAEVGDLETDTNGYTREEIIELLKNFFISKNAESHFNNYWK